MPQRPLVTSLRLYTEGGHDRITLWSRGACAGTLVLKLGDGLAVAMRLLPDGPDVAITQEADEYWRRVVE